MKKRLILLTALLLLIFAVTALSSCGQWNNPYEELDEEGASVSVKFLAGTGGMFAGTNGVTVCALNTSNKSTTSPSVTSWVMGA